MGTLKQDVKVRQFPPDGQQPTQALLQKVLEEAFGVAHAQETPEDTLDLSADRMEWDAQKEVSVYHGNVRAKQGEMILLADRLTVISDNDRVQALHAEGNARWTQILDSGKPLRANAGSILYQIRQRKAVMKKNVDLRVDSHQFTGEEVVYLIDEERVQTPATRKPSELGPDPAENRLRLMATLEAQDLCKSYRRPAGRLGGLAARERPRGGRAAGPRTVQARRPAST